MVCAQLPRMIRPSHIEKKKGAANYCTKTLTVVIALEKTPTP